MSKQAPRTEELRELSGNYTTDSNLTQFLYILMRDHLPAGVVEELVEKSLNLDEEVTYTNGWLAEYANNLAEKLEGITFELVDVNKKDPLQGIPVNTFENYEKECELQ